MDEMYRRYHEVANIFPLMQGADFDALKADIAEHGQREPIWVDDDGSILDGRNRHRACVELGLNPTIAKWNGNGSLVAFVVSLNLHRRHLTESQRAMVAAKLANMSEGRPDKTASIEAVSQADAADLLNVSRSAVQRARVVYTNGDPTLVDVVDRGEVAVSAAAQVATLPVEWQRYIVDHNEVADAARDMRNGFEDKVIDRVRPHVANNSGNNEWYTPAEYIAAAWCVLGNIDLDPASSAEANTIVQADTYYTIDDDGLAKQWMGRVWLNPPYAADLVGKFTSKLHRHYRAGDIEAAIVLVNNATETLWFQALSENAAAICFPEKRIRFWSPNGTVGAPLQGQAILYLGSDTNIFFEHFQDFGLLVTVT